MYALMENGVQIATYATLQACQLAATATQYCMFIGS